MSSVRSGRALSSPAERGGSCQGERPAHATALDEGRVVRSLVDEDGLRPPSLACWGTSGDGSSSLDPGRLSSAARRKLAERRRSNIALAM
jgi:hypothetical protein